MTRPGQTVALTRALPAALRWGSASRPTIEAIEEGYCSVLLARTTAAVRYLSDHTLRTAGKLTTAAWTRAFSMPVVAGTLAGGGSPRIAAAAIADFVDAGPDSWPPAQVVGRVEGKAPDVILRIDGRSGAVEDYWSPTASGSARATDASRVIDAVATVLESASAAAMMLRTCVHFIAVEHRHGGGAASSSWFVRPHLVGLTNIDAESDSWLVDALVHEGVHSLLYMLEVSEPWFLAGRNGGDRVRSPWTGASLPGHSFVHACFVWYALYHFWKGAPTQGAAVRREKAAAGFASPDVIAGALAQIRGMNPEVTHAIMEMARDVAQAPPPAAPTA
jgi:hypothetical protein